VPVGERGDITSE
jgi:hypothetical protein